MFTTLMINVFPCLRIYHLWLEYQSFFCVLAIVYYAQSGG